jgi:hypothetical protein
MSTGPSLRNDPAAAASGLEGNLKGGNIFLSKPIEWDGLVVFWAPSAKKQRPLQINIRTRAIMG